MTNHLLHLAALLIAIPTAAEPQPSARWWDDRVEASLSRVKQNRPELEKALTAVSRDRRQGMAFLIANMPEGDLNTLKADFLLTNVDLAYKARAAVPWGKDIPEAIFLNDVLPYANVDEKREEWRKEFYDLCLPMVKDCETPAEAAHKLNQKVFKKLKVVYSTQRKAPNQSPQESIEQGKASCTGLSIVLSDACRAVCVPARLVGTPLWANKRGNHTWVEIWDKGWHFTGACEPDPHGLDHGWFVRDAAQAKKDSVEHAIYAASFRKTGVHFPLVWAMKNKDVPAENVTDHYAKAVPDAGGSSSALKSLRDALAARPRSLGGLAEKDFARVPLTKANAAAARHLIWNAHVEILKAERTGEVKDRLLKDGDLQMPFFSKTFGAKPMGGHSLWISLHGGGNAPKRVNDQQWENQKTLYTLEEGIYVAPRAPTDTWNLWHQPHMDRLFGRLIEDLVVLEGVNPNHVYLLGYSAGGDGVYQMAPRMADRWAGAAMMAGHPNGVSPLSLRNVPFALQVGGNDSAYNRNRVAREYAARLDELRKDDPKGYEHFVKIYEGKGHWMDQEDRVALPWIAKFTRNAVPDRVVWKQTGTPHERSYWLAVPSGEGKRDSLVIARREGQTIEITAAEKVGKLLVRLDDRMVDLDRTVKITRAGKQLFTGAAPRTMAVMLRTLADRSDPELMFDAEVAVELPAEK